MNDIQSNLKITHSPQLPVWLADQNIGLALTTYQGNKLILIGLHADGRLSVQQRLFPRCMGLGVDRQRRSLWMATQFQLWRFSSVPKCAGDQDRFDRKLIPHTAYTTGSIDVHDIGLDTDGVPVFVSTLFNCLATIDPQFSFRPIWRPPFVSELVAEDRCHLNGLAMESGRAKYVTICGRTDAPGQWRGHRVRGGLVMDVITDTTVVDQLTMPHSPRVVNGQLWVLDSGTGYLCRVDVERSELERIAFCPGYARGLQVIDQWACVGISQPRHEPTFAGLPLESELDDRKQQPQCGIDIIDLKRGATSHWIRIDGPIKELYDVALLPETRCPGALGIQNDELARNVWVMQNDSIVHWRDTGES